MGIGVPTTGADFEAIHVQAISAFNASMSMVMKPKFMRVNFTLDGAQVKDEKR